MFKSNWEKKSALHPLPQNMIEKMVLLAYPNKTLSSNELIAGGCANLNFKILFEHEDSPFILRIYLRDKESALREQHLAILLHATVPIPQLYFIGEIEGYHFSIAEYMPGISLRDLLMSNRVYDLSAIMCEVGLILSSITQHQFSQAGFFDSKLNIIPHSDSGSYSAFIKNYLEHKTVIFVLTSEMIVQIHHALNVYGHLFPNINESYLVHADFDPANILVNEIQGKWKVSGVLDWEFAFSGSNLWDVANMLRYAHQMPLEFQAGFLKGLKVGGIKLPEHWRITIHLLNLESLLDCLTRSDPKNQPNQCNDIFTVIQHILTELNNVNEK